MSNLLEMKDITKVYSNGVTANSNINFNIKKGEIHALMGENGAGKSTLMKVLFGLETPDEGNIIFEGKEVDINSPSKAIDLGIGMVNQHFMLVDSLTVHENVFLGMTPFKGVFSDNEYSIKKVEEISEKYNFRIFPKERIENISVSMKQKVEIIKVLTRNPKLIILDEPTAVLTPQEIEELFEQFSLLRENGYTIIFISHKINEVMAICDRATILRDGMNIDTVNIYDTTAEEISRLMVGRDVLLNINKSDKPQGKPILEVSDLTRYDEEGVKVLNNLSFKVKEGQILGVAGVDGNGQNELAESIFGLKYLAKGNVYIDGKDVTNFPTSKIRMNGIGLIPEDRMTFGAAADMSIWENLFSDKIDQDRYNGNLGLKLDIIRSDADTLRELYEIKSMNIDQPIEMLSGGNIQKVVVARELSSNPKFLVANQPTRGIDVGAQELVWNELIEYRDKGNGILLISANLNEVLELSDSVMVMIDGEIVAFIEDSKSLSEEELGQYMLGVKRQTNVKGAVINE